MSLKEFQPIGKIGEGAYSSVYKVKRIHDNQEYALKKVKLQNLSEKEKDNALNEVRILASIKHKNIIGYKEAFIDQPSNCLCIVMDYADNGDLYQKILEQQKKQTLFSEEFIWKIFIQIVQGLNVLHQLKINHRDLKTANVFLNLDGTAQLGDMNVSKVAKQGLLHTQTGTPYYASPEVWKDQPYNNKSDIWSLGCVLYEMTTLKPPFRAEDMEGLYKKVIKGLYRKIPSEFSGELSQIIRVLLQTIPEMRPSCERILNFSFVSQKLEELGLQKESDSSVLLNTIKIPKNMSYLTEKLPKPQYQMLQDEKDSNGRLISRKESLMLPTIARKNKRYMKERQDKSIDVVRRNDSNLKNNRYEESSLEERIESTKQQKTKSVQGSLLDLQIQEQRKKDNKDDVDNQKQQNRVPRYKKQSKRGSSINKEKLPFI